MNLTIPESTPIMLETRYGKELGVADRMTLEKRVYQIFGDLGFRVIAKSAIGLSVSSTRGVMTSARGGGLKNSEPLKAD